jgi:hypothetical protein
MKRQSTRRVVSQVASDAVVLAEVGAEVIAAGVLLTSGIVGAAVELGIAKLSMSEKHPDHVSTSAP